MRHQRQRTALGQWPGCAGIELQLWALQAQAVGPQQVHALAAGNFLQLGCLFGGDAARDDERRAAGHPTRNLQRRRHILGGQGDDGQVRPGLGQLSQRAATVNVQKPQAAREGLRLQRGHHRTCLRCLRLGVVHRPRKHNDGLGREQGGEEMFVHGVL